MPKKGKSFTYDTFVSSGECSSGLFDNSPVMGEKKTTSGSLVDRPLSWYELLQKTAQELNESAEIIVKPQRFDPEDTAAYAELPPAFDPEFHTTLYEVVVNGVKQEKFQRAMMLPEVVEINVAHK